MIISWVEGAEEVLVKGHKVSIIQNGYALERSNSYHIVTLGNDVINSKYLDRAESKFLSNYARYLVAITWQQRLSDRIF